MICASRIRWNNIDLYLKADEMTLLSLGFEEPVGIIWEDNKVLVKCKQQLQEYFNGKRREFDVPIRFIGTDFQKLVWNKLLEIPYGQVMTYREVAEAIGKPKAVRAVGRACNKNPIAIVIPCHRVIGKNGFLTGYAGGLDMKKQLLKLEECSEIIGFIGS